MILTIDIDELEPELVKFYEKSDNKSKIQDALIHGYKIVHSNTYALNLKNSDEMSTQKIAELSTKNSAHVTQIADLETQIHALKNTHILEIEQTRQNLKTEFNRQIYELEQSNLKRETEIRTLSEETQQHKIQNLESELSIYKTQLKQANDKCLAIQDNARQDYQPRIDKLQLDLDQKQQQIEQYLAINNNSSRKGNKGEEEMEIILNKLFPCATISRKSKEKKSGDFRIEYRGIQVLVENKEYTGNVPKEEIEKFARDCSLPDVDCGIMCSELSGVAKREDLEIEIVDEKPVIYLCNVRMNFDKIRIAVLILINMIQNNLEISKGDLQEIKEIIRNIESIKAICQENIKGIKNLEENHEKLMECNTGNLKRLESLQSRLDSDFKKKKKCNFCKGSYIKLEEHIRKKHPENII